MSLGDIIRGGITTATAPEVLIKRAVPPIKFTNDPFEYIQSQDYLGEKLYPVQRSILEKFFEKDSEGKSKYQELILMCGMRSGKSILAAWLGSFFINTLMALGLDYKMMFGLSKSTTITVPCIASSEAQVDRTVFAYVKKILNESEFWKKVNQWLIDQEPIGSKGKYYFTDTQNIRYGYYDLHILALASTSDTLAGLTSYCTIFDEISRLNVSDKDLHGKTQKRSAQALYYTLVRQTKTFKEHGKSIVVTSPMYEDDFGMQLLYKSDTIVTGEVGKYTIPLLASKVPQMQKKKSRIAFHYATWEYNPTYSGPEDFEEEKRESISTYKRDFMAMPPATISPFIDDRTVIQSAVLPKKLHILECESDVRDRERRDPLTNILLETRSYVIKKIKNCVRDKITPRFICCDQAEKYDSFVLGIAHPELKEVEKEGVKQKFFRTIVDALVVWEPLDGGQITVDFDNVEKTILELTQYLNILTVTYDRWQSTKSIQSLFDSNVNSQILSITTAMYESFKTRLYAGLIESVDVTLEASERKNALADELLKLQRIRTKIDHGEGQTKDLADTVCRLDALVQNYEYENFGIGRQRMVGGGISIDPSNRNFSANSVYSTLFDAYGPSSNGIWSSADDRPKFSFDTYASGPLKNIWGRQGSRNIKKSPADRKQHPAQDFFRMKR